jgi:hypothetical protein
MAQFGFAVFSRAFRLAYRRAYRHFLADLATPARAQARLLAALVQGLSGTEYGRQHGLARNDGYARFAQKLPIVDYDEVSPWIRRQQRSRRPILCPGGAAFYERTSGSSGASKEIPYTRGLQASFVRMFLLWAYDCIEYGPRLRSGSTFLSVSPNLSPRRPTDGEGLDSVQDDTDYLPPLLRWLFGRYLVLPRGLRQITDPIMFKRILAAYLLNEPELEVISVWNPTYFSSLLEFIEGNRSLAAKDLLAGEIATGRQVFRFPKATAAHRRRCAESLEAGSLDFRAIWPQLRLLSCWTDGNAALVLEPLRRRLPHAVVQSKGLVATEAPMTIPLWQASGPVPLLAEVFFEFVGEDGKVCRLHEVEVGGRYDLIISQRGGLARYRIGDQVEVVGRFYATPTLRFVGRSRQISDLVGEKLNENFVRDSLNGLAHLTRGRWMLVPAVAEGVARYICLFDGPHPIGDLADAIDDTLQHAHHYRLARQLGQLAAIAVERHERLDEAYLAWSSARGRKWGNVKPCALISDVERAGSFLQYVRAAPGRTNGSSA